jgi:hypothetical protein
LTEQNKGALLLDTADNEKQLLTFSAEAKALWKQYAQGIEDAMKEGQPYEYYKDHASKLMENISRMAALIHYFEGYEGEISKETLSFSYDFARKCSIHFQRYFAGEPQAVTDANDIAKLILDYIDKGYQSTDFIPHRGRISRHLKYNISIDSGRKADFRIAFLKQFGPNRLRHRAADPRLRNAIDFLRKLGHIEYNAHAKNYHFSETLVKVLEPEWRNGIHYHLDALPMQEEQIAHDPGERGRYWAYYLIVQN